MSDGGIANRLKGAAPAGLAALAIVGALVGGSLLTAEEEAAMSSSAPAVAPAASAPSSTAPSSTVAPSPGAVPGVAFDQAPGAGGGVGMEIVVKFKDDGKVKDIIDAFWKDPGSAKAKFNAFKSGRSEFSDVSLARVTYSNELVLVHQGGGSPAASLPAMREIASRLKSVADISYAEPNMTAHPGGQ
jgi:hypothetical protein